jgi:TolB-like protein/Flp pilus assembly protein TadD
LAVSGATWWWAERPEFEPADLTKFAYKLPDKPSLAVLPFDNLSSDPKHALFADAISGDLTNNLARISNLFVIARQATASYKTKPIEVRQVAEDLGVQNVVFGNVRRIDDRVRVNVQMVDALSGHQLWTGRFDRQVTDIFALQDEIANAIATQLSGILTWSSGPRQTDNVDAHLIWVSAQGDVLPSSPQRLAHAKALAEKAIKLDPNYSRAYALLALARTQNGYFGYVEDRKKAISDGLDLAKKAVALADNDWYSHFVYAQALMNTRDYDGAITAHDRAIALDPSNALLLTFSALPLIFQGYSDKAISRLETAMRINPYLTWPPPNFMGMALYLKGDYKQAIPYLEKAGELNPKFIGTLLLRAAAYAQTGRTEEAETMVKQVLTIKPGTTISSSFIIIKDQVQMERLREGWRKAGLPE